MNTEEQECLRALADTLHSGDYITLVWRNERIGGTVRWVYSHGLSLDLGMPQAWRAVLGWPDVTPHGHATFEW